jgi:capsid protein
VNYSSIRAGLLEEREVWKSLQRYLIEHLCEPLFSSWLEDELAMNRLGLPIGKMFKFDVPEFQGRRWAWVDPKKDMEASIMGIRAGLTSARKVIAEGGGDIYDIYAAQQADKALAEEKGLSFPELVDAPKAAAPVAVIDTPD